ncbi:MAG TPA: ABC transporter permease [Terriglobales bacterium]
MSQLLRELRYGLRSLRQAPAFAAIAILTLGLGLGANTAIFSMVDAVLLRPLPFPQPDRLIEARESSRNFPSMSDSYPDFLDWAADTHSFTGLAAYRNTDDVLTHAGTPAIVSGQDATAQYFDVLGIKPELGRTFTPAEDRVGAPDVVVIADRLWRERFGTNPAVLGMTMDLDARPRTIIGVMPRGFPGLAAGEDAAQYWLPLGAEATKASGLMFRGSHQGLDVLGRTKPGVTLAAARADLESVARALSQQYPKSNTGVGVTVGSYLDRVVRNDGPSALWVLLAAVGLVLLIACANVANLLLARAATRQKPNAIRAAMGASRARLIREHLIESLCLGVAGSAVGLGLALLAMRAAPLLIPPGLDMTRTDQLGLDWRVMLFTIALALTTSVIFGLAPAWQASRAGIGEILKQGGRDAASGVGAHRLRNTLVGVEMALALVLLVGAGLLIRSLLRLQQVNPGFDPHHTLTFSVDLPDVKYPTPEKSLEFFRQARERMVNLPSVSAVGMVRPLPFGGSDWENGFTIVGRPAPAPGSEPSTNYAMIGGDYFKAMGMHLLRGRNFNDDDTAKSPPVAIIDTVFAQRYWPGADPMQNALGQQIGMGDKKLTVVGVTARVLDYGLDAATEMDRLPELFVPLAQTGNSTDAYFVVRTGLDSPLQLRAGVTAAVQAGDADQPVYDMLTMDQRVALSLAQRRLTLWLMIGFAGLALILAAIGIYGVLSYAVAQRVHEIGIRMALGADHGRVLGQIMGHGLRLAGLGAIAGLGVALIVGRFGASFLYGVGAADPVVLVAVPATLLAVAALACYLPARRATRVDPMIALRGE